MSVKLDWGSALVGAMFLLVGGIFLLQARAAFVYHTPIYTRGPSWLDPWAAVLGGRFSSLSEYMLSVLDFTGGKNKTATAEHHYTPCI
jgi:hypothetical protein